MVLTCGALLTLVVEATDLFRTPGRAPLTLALGGVYALVATVGFGWVRHRDRSVALGYVAVQLALGMAMFATAHRTVGASLLLVVLVMQCVVLLSLPAALLVTLVVPLGHLGMTLQDGLRAGMATLVGCLFGAVSAELWMREQRAREALAEAHAQLRGYAAQAEELATTQERNRLARDIHDGLGHHLTVVQMQLQAARAVLASDPQRGDGLLAKAQQEASAALAEVRRSVAALREPRTVAPLPESVEQLAAASSAAGTPTDVELIGEVRELPAETEEALYRTAQEGLTNVRKHARATRATVRVDYRDPDTVTLEVRDDGTGAPPEGPRGGFGLVGVRERAARLGGSLRIDSVPGRGLTLRVEMPG